MKAITSIETERYAGDASTLSIIVAVLNEPASNSSTRMAVVLVFGYEGANTKQG